MALTSIGQGAMPAQTISAQANVLLLDASGEEAAFIVRASKAGDIRKFHFRVGTVTTGETLRVSAQDVQVSTGDPDGAADQSGTVTVANTDDNTWKTVTLSADRTVARDELYACVIAFDSAVGNLNIVCGGSIIFNNIYADLKTGGSWVKQARAPLLVPEYSDGSYDMMPGVNAAIQVNVDYGSGATPDEVGNKLTLAAPMALRGASFLGRLTGNMDIVLYDASSNVMATSSLFTAVKMTTEGNQYAPFPDVVLQPGTYRVVLKPGAASIRRIEMSYPTAGAIAQDEFGAAFSKTSRTDGGAWTDDPTSRVAMQLYASKINDASVPSGFKGVTL